MARMFTLDPVDASFLDTARYRYEFSMELSAPADEVWDGLTAHEPQRWCRMLTAARFASPADRGIGSTRTSEVARGVLKFRERFFVWDEDNRHHAFYVEELNLPLLRAFAEDCRVTPSGTGCQFTWTFAFEPRAGFRAAVRLGLPGITWLLRSLARDTETAFGKRRVR